MKWQDISNCFEEHLSSAPMSASPLSNYDSERMRDTSLGGTLGFTATRYSEGKTVGCVLETVEQGARVAVERRVRGTRHINAYWAPQGKSIGIKQRPDLHGGPEFLFTPDFSGCSLVVERTDAMTLRVSHLEGGRHEAQLAELGINTQKITSALCHAQYKHAGGPQAFAFMKFDRADQEWKIHCQARSGTANIRGTDVVIVGPSQVNGYFSKSAFEIGDSLSALRSAVEAESRQSTTSPRSAVEAESRQSTTSVRPRFERSASPEPLPSMNEARPSPSLASRPSWQRTEKPSKFDTSRMGPFLAPEGPDR